MGKGHVVIARSINNTFNSPKNYRTARRTEWGPRAERAGVEGPIDVGGQGVTSGIRAEPK